MIYLLTTICLLLGVLFHVMVKVTGYKKKFPELTFRTIWKVFLKEEWDSLIVSAWFFYVGYRAWKSGTAGWTWIGNTPKWVESDKRAPFFSVGQVIFVLVLSVLEPELSSFT